MSGKWENDDDENSKWNWNSNTNILHALKDRNLKAWK